MLKYVQAQGGSAAAAAAGAGRRRRRRRGRRRCWSREGNRIVGLVVLEDILKPGISERFERLRKMGLRTVMVTGDNPLTAKSIAEQAGVDDYIAEATPEAKLAYIRKEQDGGQAGRHDGRRHQRRPGPGPGRRRRGDELRHAGRQGSRQHGRPRQRPDQADRGRRDRQAAADDPRGADDVLDRQRPGQVLRHRPGPVRRHAAVAEGARLHAPGARRRRRSCRR